MCAPGISRRFFSSAMLLAERKILMKDGAGKRNVS
jgi:hypothetical protein